MFQNPSADVLRQKKLFLFDMDGTLYLGERVFPFAVRFLRNLRAQGKKVLFFTNNSSAATQTYIDRLKARGFDPQPGEVMTSGDVTIEFLKRHRAGKSVYVCGTPDLLRAFRAAGLDPLPEGTKKADIAVLGYDTELTYTKLCDMCRLVRGGSEYLATHKDLTCPNEEELLPDCGATIAFIKAMSGKEPVAFGKPERETVEMLCEVSGCELSEMCIFGDMLTTDMAMGKRNGITCCLLLSGETHPEHLAALDEKDYPDFVFGSLDDADKLLFPAK